MVVTFGSGKHEIEDVTSETRVSELKVRLERMVGMPSAHMRLLVKGKEAKDTATLGSLSVSDGTKLMLMRSSMSASSCTSESRREVSEGSSDPVTRDDCEMKRSNAFTSPITLGDGPVTLTVVHGKQQYTLRCNQGSRINDLKQLLQTPCRAPVSQQRLLNKGKEVLGEATVSQLDLLQGGKLMLLFREGFHLEAEGAANLARIAVELESLEKSWTGLQRKVNAV